MKRPTQLAFESLPSVFTQKQLLNALKKVRREGGVKSYIQHYKSQGLVRTVGYQVYEKVVVCS